MKNKKNCRLEKLGKLLAKGSTFQKYHDVVQPVISYDIVNSSKLNGSNRCGSTLQKMCVKKSLKTVTPLKPAADEHFYCDCGQLGSTVQKSFKYRQTCFTYKGPKWVFQGNVFYQSFK